ncbi:MAG TPA: hypothetical protein VG369_13195 [Humibacter sp.]|nr:hypothetical protein [Humibacter sp.]
MDVKWIIGVSTGCAAALSAVMFLGLAVLGNESRLREEEWAPDEVEWVDE